jgi:hypothetical protein
MMNGFIPKHKLSASNIKVKVRKVSSRDVKKSRILMVEEMEMLVGKEICVNKNKIIDKELGDYYVQFDPGLKEYTYIWDSNWIEVQDEDNII